MGLDMYRISVIDLICERERQRIFSARFKLKNEERRGNWT